MNENNMKENMKCYVPGHPSSPALAYAPLTIPLTASREASAKRRSPIADGEGRVATAGGMRMVVSESEPPGQESAIICICCNNKEKR